MDSKTRLPRLLTEVARLGYGDARRQPSFPSLAAFSHGAVTSAASLAIVAKWSILGLPASGIMFTLDRFELLDRAIQAVHTNGLWLEFGVSAGRSINHIADRTDQPVFGFDTFEGLPEYWTPRHGRGAYSTRGLLPVVHPRVSLIKGRFETTLPGFLAAHAGTPVAFLHIDCDLYSSTRTVLSGLGPRIDVGTVIVFDEFCGAIPDDEERAWREYCRKVPTKYDWLGYCMTGSVALRVTSRG